jgi:hypothetical protein
MMNDPRAKINLMESPTILNGQADIEFFEPPMCCPTGLCGPTVDQALLDLNEMIAGLQKEGFAVGRYQMTTHPQAFLGNPEVMRLIREKQMAALPLVLVRGKIVSEGRYPTRVEILTQLKED